MLLLKKRYHKNQLRQSDTIALFQTSFKTLVSKKTVEVEKSHSKDKLLEKLKHLSKQVAFASVTYTLEKKMFAAATFEGL